MLNKVSRSPYLLFLPFLCFYFYYIHKYRYPQLYGDEPRYIGFAQNLLHGFYSPPAPGINLWNGPGYPIILAPFIALHIPGIYLCFLNAVFMYVSVVFLYQACRLFIRKNIALTAALLWALYPNMLHICLSVYSEAFTAFLVTGLLFAVALFYTRRHKKYLLIAGLILGFITLTKIVFGYVLPVCLLMSLVAMVFTKWRNNAQNTALIMLIAFMVTAPYLFYTYKLTHKVYYWGNSGGMSLYWMSTPFDNEYGDWKEENLHNSTFPLMYGTREGDSLLRKNHQQDINLVSKYAGVQRDSAYKAIAIQNIRQHPKKYIRNYYCNLARMLFDFPYSYYYHNDPEITNILTGSLLLWASVIGLVVSLVNYRQLVYPVKFCLLVTGIYLLLSGLLSAYPRQLDVVAPLLLFWLVFVAEIVLVNRRKRHPMV